MEKGKARDFWIDDLTLKVCGPWSDVKEMSWPDCEKVLHVREVIPLTAEEELVILRCRHEAKDGNGVPDDDVQFLLEIIDKLRGVIA